MQTLDRIDLYKDHKDEYAATPEPRIVTIGPALYLAAEGRGEPGGIEFGEKLSALYGVLYTIKFAAKHRGQDFKASGMEGLWWTPSGGSNFLQVPPQDWCWQLMVRVPEFVSVEDLETAREELQGRGKTGDFDSVGLESLDEGVCVQALHVGPYETESETLRKMDELVQREGLMYRGLHHEIYLSDPRRVPTERIRTILRHPVS
jgi:hypothetical protein